MAERSKRATMCGGVLVATPGVAFVDLQHVVEGARKSDEGEVHAGGRTVGNGQPSILLLDLELVAESLRLCILSFSVHKRLRTFVRRLRSRFHVRLLRGGGRHVYSASCRPFRDCRRSL